MQELPLEHILWSTSHKVIYHFTQYVANRPYDSITPSLISSRPHISIRDEPDALYQTLILPNAVIDDVKIG